MTTISRTTIPVPPAIAKGGGVPVPNKSELSQFKPKILTAAEKADFAQRDAKVAKAEAEFQKRKQEVDKAMSVEGMESHEMYMPNVSDLSLDNAKKSLGIAQVMIKNKEDVGVNVHGRYGDQEISDLHTYTVALKEYIGKLEAATAGAGADAPPVNTTAASTYRQMQEMVKNSS